MTDKPDENKDPVLDVVTNPTSVLGRLAELLDWDDPELEKHGLAVMATMRQVDEFIVSGEYCRGPLTFALAVQMMTNSLMFAHPSERKGIIDGFNRQIADFVANPQKVVVPLRAGKHGAN